MKIAMVTAVALLGLSSSVRSFTALSRSSPTRRSMMGIARNSAVPGKVAATSSSTSKSDSSDASHTALNPEFAAVCDGTIDALKKSVDNEKLLQPLVHFITEYFTANQKAFMDGNADASPTITANRILKVIQLGMTYGMGPNKYTFGVTHKALRGDGTGATDNAIEKDDYDYYAFGCDFFAPVMNMKQSKVLGADNAKKAFEQVNNGENVVFFANHQSEADPQVFSQLLDSIGFGQEAAEVVYVAGHKVTTDPLAIPFSMGRNLLCIHSKKHIDADAETKPIKQRQNVATMGAMLGMMKQGGATLWVAPSGGRDRRDVNTKEVPIAPFDYKTIDMFRLLGNKSKKPTHYYPLAMVSYDLCPPPDYIEAGVGEQRNVRYVPVGIGIGEEVESKGGLELRKEFCEQAQGSVEHMYQELLDELKQ